MNAIAEAEAAAPPPRSSNSTRVAWRLLRVRARALLKPLGVPVLAARTLLRRVARRPPVATNRPLDESAPQPRYTSPAIDFLRQLDLRDKAVFEFGPGMSTLFWSERARRIVSVEDNEQWYATVASQAPSNAHVIFEPDLRRYADAVGAAGEPFDIIVVDGAVRGDTRLRCCRAAVRALRRGGFIVLDDADSLPESTRFLREQQLIQVDMTGFAPMSGEVQTTSLFFDRAFGRVPQGNRLPARSLGERAGNWEAPPPDIVGESIECDGEHFRGVSTTCEWEYATAQGERRFMAFSYVAPDAERRLAILEPALDRVTLSRYGPSRPEAGESLETELYRLATLTWEQMRAFVNAHPLRRYRL
jgi:predicted O-methyltransferase YrrM